MKKEDGYAIVLALIMILIVMIFLTIVMYLVSNEINFVSHAKDSIKTFYIAEAGLEYASSFLKDSDLSDDTIWDDNKLTNAYLLDVNDIVNNKITLSEVKAVKSGNEITLTSTAEHDSGIEKAIEVTYNKISLGSNFYDYSLVANGNIALKNKVIVEGVVDDDNLDLDGDGIANIDDTDADGDDIDDSIDTSIELNGNIYDPTPDYYGDIYTTGIVTESNKTNLKNSAVLDDQSQDIVPDIYSDVYSQFESEITDGVPNEDPDVYININDIYDNASKKYSFNDDIVYSSTNLEFKNNEEITGNGILLVNGDINFKNGVNISTSDYENMIIIASGNITFNNSSGFSGMVYAGGKISIKAKVDIDGSVISKTAIEEDTITVNNGGNDPSEIVFDNSYLDVFTTLGVTIPSKTGDFDYDLEITSWEEK